MSKVTINGGRITNCHTGLKTRGKIDLTVNGLEIDKTNTAYDLSNQTKEPKDDKDTNDGAAKRIIDKVMFPVSAGLILAMILGGFTFMRPRFGF